MKKILIVLFASMMLFATGCGCNKKDTTNDNNTATSGEDIPNDQVESITSETEFSNKPDTNTTATVKLTNEGTADITIGVLTAELLDGNNKVITKADQKVDGIIKAGETNTYSFTFDYIISEDEDTEAYSVNWSYAYSEIELESSKKEASK